MVNSAVFIQEEARRRAIGNAVFFITEYLQGFDESIPLFLEDVTIACKDKLMLSALDHTEAAQASQLAYEREQAADERSYQEDC